LGKGKEMPQWESPESPEKREIFYITFGWGHEHKQQNHNIDRNTLIRVFATRIKDVEKMASEIFKSKWSMVRKEDEIIKEHWPNPKIIDIGDLLGGSLTTILEISSK